jgi:hypothetical protein
MAVSKSSPSAVASPRSPVVPALSAKPSSSPPPTSTSKNTPIKSPTAQQALGTPKSGKIKLSPSEICEFQTSMELRRCNLYIYRVNGSRRTSFLLRAGRMFIV